MSTIQDFFNQIAQKENKQIFLEGNKLKEKLEGNSLIIEDFKQLQDIYIADLPNLTKLTIKNCEELSSLDLYLDKHIEIVLIGEFPKLNNFKTTSTLPQPIIIKNQDCKCGGSRLIFECILILLS